MGVRIPTAETELAAIIGEEHVRPAGPDDAIDGVQARWVVEPGSAEDAWGRITAFLTKTIGG